MNKEVKNEIFYKAPLRDSQGRNLPIPPEGLIKAQELKKEWLKQVFPEGIQPVFSISRKVLDDGTEGFH
jgi:hypothetical protein